MLSSAHPPPELRPTQRSTPAIRSGLSKDPLQLRQWFDNVQARHHGIELFDWHERHIGTGHRSLSDLPSCSDDECRPRLPRQGRRLSEQIIRLRVKARLKSSRLGFRCHSCHANQCTALVRHRKPRLRHTGPTWRRCGTDRPLQARAFTKASPCGRSITSHPPDDMRSAQQAGPQPAPRRPPHRHQRHDLLNQPPHPCPGLPLCELTSPRQSRSTDITTTSHHQLSAPPPAKRQRPESSQPNHRLPHTLVRLGTHSHNPPAQAQVTPHQERSTIGAHRYAHHSPANHARPCNVNPTAPPTPPHPEQESPDDRRCAVRRNP